MVPPMLQLTLNPHQDKNQIGKKEKITPLLEEPIVEQRQNESAYGQAKSKHKKQSAATMRNSGKPVGRPSNKTEPQRLSY